MGTAQYRPDPGDAGRATNLADVVPVESELAARDAELDSLLQRQKELASHTSLGTVSVSFVVLGNAGLGKEDIGFLSGLRGGWKALVDAVTVAAAVIGVLAFAVTAELLGVPVFVGAAPAHRQTAPPAAVATATDQS